MNSKTIDERELRRLILKWKKREKEYEEAMLKGENPERHRYEGISKGMRWCWIDLETLLKVNSNG